MNEVTHPFPGVDNSEIAEIYWWHLMILFFYFYIRASLLYQKALFASFYNYQ